MEDYEPNLLCAMMASFEGHLKKKNYGYCILIDIEFEKARRALKSRRKANEINEFRSQKTT